MMTVHTTIKPHSKHYTPCAHTKTMTELSFLCECDCDAVAFYTQNPMTTDDHSHSYSIYAYLSVYKVRHKIYTENLSLFWFGRNIQRKLIHA